MNQQLLPTNYHKRQVLLLSLLIALVMLGGCKEHPKPTHSIEVASHGINAGALSIDGQYAVVGSVFHGGSLWRTEDGERFYNWNHSQGGQDDRVMISADIDPANQRALTTDASTLVLWEIETGEALRFWSSPAEILASKLAVNGRYAILGLADHSAVMFDAIRGGISRTFHHKGRVRSVDLSTDNRLAITGSEDKTAVIWRIDDGSRVFEINHNEDVQLVKLSADGRYAITAAKYDRVELWDVQQQKSLGNVGLKKQWIKRGLRITAAEFSHNNQYLLLGYPNQTVELRDTQSLALIKKWALPKRKHWQPTAVAIIDLAFDHNNQQYWAMSSDGFIHQLEK